MITTYCSWPTILHIARCSFGPKGYGALPDPPLSEPVEQVDAGIISWQSHGILKDDELCQTLALHGGVLCV